MRKLLASAALALLGAVPAAAYTVYVSNERGNSITIIDSETMEVVETVDVGQRPRGITLSPDGKHLYILASDDDSVQVLDTETRQLVHSLPSGPDPELGVLHPSGNPLYVANEDDNLVTVDRRRGRHHSRRDAGRRRAGGHGHQPGRQVPGQYLRDHQHGAFHRHRDQ